MAKARGLGKSIFDTFDDNLIESKKGAGEMLKISSVEPRRDQPRKTFERESLEALAESIQKYGVLQPIIVRPNQIIDDTYEIIAGERRWRAAKLAGLDEIPAVILDGDDLKIAQVSIIENIQREDLNAVEEALAYQGLIYRFGLTQDQVSKQVGKSCSAIFPKTYSKCSKMTRSAQVTRVRSSDLRMKLTSRLSRRKSSRESLAFAR